MTFADGGKPQGELVKGEATDVTGGTSQTFYPDGTIFESTEFDFETLRARFQQMAFLNKGLRITLTDERPVNRDGDDDLDLDAVATEAKSQPSTAQSFTNTRTAVGLRQAPELEQEG